MLLEEAAEVLPEDPDRIEFHDGRAWSLNYPDRSASMADLARHAHHKNQRDLVVAETFASQAMAVSDGAHFVKARVDTETGEVKVLDYVAVHDVAPPSTPCRWRARSRAPSRWAWGIPLSEGIDRGREGKGKERHLPHLSHLYVHRNAAYSDWLCG